MFRSIWDEVELHGLEIDGDKKSPANLNKLAETIKMDKADEFDILCAQWEQASQIRKWTQELKKDLTESLKTECREELIAEIKERNDKEKEEKRQSEDNAKDSKVDEK